MTSGARLAIAAAGFVLSAGSADAGEKASGGLSVVTTPWTEVVVDGEKIGTTPVVDHEVQQGKHEVKLVNSDLEISVSMSVTIEQGKTTKIVRTFEVEASGSTGTLSVATTPAAKILVDGKEVGTTPVSKITLEAGEHEVVIVHDGLGIHETLKVTIEAGKNRAIVKNLESKAPPKAKKSGTLSVTTAPSTSVYVDGKGVGTTPIVKLGLAAGKHKLRLVNEDEGIEKTLTIKIEAGKDTSIIESFE